MLDLSTNATTEWKPDELPDQVISACMEEAAEAPNGYLAIFRTEPYIDAVFIKKSFSEKDNDTVKRFVFLENYAWSYEDEEFFQQYCVKNEWLRYTSAAIEPIFKYYSAKYPEWHLKRYYTQSMRMLDHIYHCMRKGTAKEMLFKAGLDELAENLEDIGEYNLLSTKPSELYDGVSTRTLRALNCKSGSALLSTAANRVYVRELQRKAPDLFKKNLNDAHCRYLMHLISAGLTLDETVRLFKARYRALQQIWIDSQYGLFLQKEKSLEHRKAVEVLDPIYKDAIEKGRLSSAATNDLANYLVFHRDEFNKKIRRANRKRNQDLEERTDGYFVRFPQTINDFCREAVYMSNCLLGYAEAFMEGDTTILFLRQTCDVNKPFITMEIFNGSLMQAYHRFNEHCTPDEADWIRAYCDRHGIGCEFSFNHRLDAAEDL